MKSSPKTLLCAALAAAALAGCGAERGERFIAARLLTFGDETSVIDTAGRKYTINALNAAGAIDCTANPIWVQAVATSFNRPFAECPGTATSAPSRILAVPGARVADLTGQIDRFLAGGGRFGDHDLATVLVGQNDILDVYGRYSGSNADALVAAVEALGAQAAAQVTRIADLGARVLLATVPDLGLTPFGRAQGTDRAALLSTLTRRYNIGLLLGIPNDGHRIGLVRSDDLVRNLVGFGNRAGYSNVAEAACVATAPLPNCNTATLVSGAAATLVIGSNGLPTTATTWLWADDRQLSPAGHVNLGVAATQRAQNNPF